jgi:hypothetical protein
MSRFTVILTSLLGFWLFSGLMGMEKERRLAPFKYSNPYFDLELQKTLLLWMQKNKYPNEFALPKDVLKEIAKKNYDLHCAWRSKEQDDFNCLVCGLKLNKDKRTNHYQGAEIKFNDFDLITMNKEGTEVFFNSLHCIPLLDSYDLEFAYKSLPHESSFELKTNINRGFLSQDDYHKALDLPLRLRCKVGESCSVYVIGHTVSRYSFTEEGLLFMSKQALFGAIIGPVANVILDNVMFDPAPISNVKSACGGVLIGGVVGVAGHVIEMKYKEHKDFKQYGYRIKLVEKPLITLEEQEIREKAKLELVAYLKRKPISVKQYKPVELKKLLVKDALCLKNLE